MANTRRHRYAVSSLMDTVYWLSESLIFKISSFKLQNAPKSAQKRKPEPAVSNVNGKASTSQPKENKEAASQSNAFFALEEDNGNPMDDLVDETRKKVEVPSKKTPKKTACRRTHFNHTAEDDLEVFSTEAIGLDWISAHNFLTRLQKLSSYAFGHLEVSELAACLEKLHFSALLVMSKLVPSCYVIFDLEPLSLSFDFVISLEIFKSFSLRSLPPCDLVS
ncbi:hypothetical protein Tco_0019288 [Tanacetum coccineum]